ncbi:MAG: histidine kinase [Pseudomonadota bacterium]
MFFKIIDHTLYQNLNNTILKDFGLTLLFNTIIAGFLTFVSQDDPFLSNFVISQCIGLTIFSLCRCSLTLFQPQHTFWLMIIVIVAIVIGGGLGGLLGGWLSGIKPAEFAEQKVYAGRILVLSLSFGGLIAFFFFSRKMILTTQQLLQTERIQRLTSEKNAAQTQLKMLQAQIEPHFLFNTLSNILSLLDTDVATGRQMLQDLTCYLRASLAETRSQWTTLGGELTLAGAYLNIFKIRMGERLQVRIDVEEDLKPVKFPPMLLQPLVENAILHGLETTVDGGLIHISAEKEKALLRVTVADTGKGFGETQPESVGLTNVRERIRALYGSHGRVLIMENQPVGIKVVLEVPYVDQ